MDEWPAYYPENVPPPDAIDTSGIAYRLVSTLPPSNSDFKSTYEKDPNNDYGDGLWMACGASLFTDIEGVLKTRKRFRPLRKKKIAVGEMVVSLGKMKNTTPGKNSHKSHITVWFRLSSEPEKYINHDAEK